MTNKIKRYREKKIIKRDTTEKINELYEGKEMTFNAFRGEIFPLKPTDSTGIPGMSAPVARISDYYSFTKLTPN